MASSSTGLWAAYNTWTACCAAKGSRGPYHRHCGCALHSLPHEFHSPSANECVSMPRYGTFRSLSMHTEAQKKSNNPCSGSPLTLQHFESCSLSVGQSSSGEKVLSIGLIRDSEEEYEDTLQAASNAVE